MFPKMQYSSLEGQIEAAAKIIQASLKYYFMIMKLVLLAVSRVIPSDRKIHISSKWLAKNFIHIIIAAEDVLNIL